MKVLVTGVKGQLGFDVVNELKKRGGGTGTLRLRQHPEVCPIPAVLQHRRSADNIRCFLPVVDSWLESWRPVNASASVVDQPDHRFLAGLCDRHGGTGAGHHEP